MVVKCYSTQEILLLDSMDDHVRSCPACRARFEKKERLTALLRREGQHRHSFWSAVRADQRALTLLQKLRALPEDRRVAAIREADALSPGMVSALCDEARVHHFRSPKRAAEWLEAAGEVIDALRRDPGPYRGDDIRWALARYKMALGNQDMVHGDLRAYEEHIGEAYHLFSLLGDEFQQALVVRSMLFSLTRAGKAEEAERRALGALAVLRAYGSRKERLYLWINLSMVLLHRSKIRRAERVLDRLLKLLPVEDPYYHLAVHNHVLLWMEKGETDRALRELRDLRALDQSRGLAVEEGRTLIMEGEVLILKGRFGEALQALEKAEVQLRPHQAGYDLSLIDTYAAKALYELSRHPEALTRLRRAIAYFSAEGYALELIHALELWEKAMRETPAREADEARKAFDTLRNMFRITPFLPKSV